MDDPMLIVMSDAEIAETLAGARCTKPQGDYYGDYHRRYTSQVGYEIVDGVIYLGGGDQFYAYPLTIDELRAAFDIRRPRSG